MKILLQIDCINNRATRLKIKEIKKECKTALCGKIKERREAEVNG